MKEKIAEEIDKLINIDFLARGIISKLYAAARGLTDTALTFEAANRIMQVIGTQEMAFVLTGFIIDGKQETDGPLGAASLARALSKGFKTKPLLIVPEVGREILHATLDGIGMKICDAKELKTKSEGFVALESLPLESKAAQEKARRIVDEYRPVVMIAVENAGRNSLKVYHKGKGFDVSAEQAKTEPLFELAHKMGILTVAVGDGGNELGMGNIMHSVRKWVPYGRTCKCACKGGVAAECESDVLVTATVSNWGAYGISASLALLTENTEVLHTPQLEQSMLRACCDAGAHCHFPYSVDRLPMSFHSCLVGMLHEILKARYPRI